VIFDALRQRKEMSLLCKHVIDTDRVFKAPSQLPLFPTMLHDIPARPAVVARHLGVTERSIYKWKAAERAPRAVQLALFWETQWGQSIIDTTAQNGAMYHRNHVMALEREIARLQALCDQLILLADTANSPVFRKA